MGALAKKNCVSLKWRQHHPVRTKLVPLCVTSKDINQASMQCVCMWGTTGLWVGAEKQRSVRIFPILYFLFCRSSPTQIWDLRFPLLHLLHLSLKLLSDLFDLLLFAIWKLRERKQESIYQLWDFINIRSYTCTAHNTTPDHAESMANSLDVLRGFSYQSSEEDVPDHILYSPSDSPRSQDNFPMCLQDKFFQQEFLFNKIPYLSHMATFYRKCTEH